MVSGDFEESLISLGEDGGWWVVGGGWFLLIQNQFVPRWMNSVVDLSKVYSLSCKYRQT